MLVAVLVVSTFDGLTCVSIIVKDILANIQRSNQQLIDRQRDRLVTLDVRIKIDHIAASIDNEIDFKE
jgi:DNA-directed RNA polymerase subunit E'/Rpb7